MELIADMQFLATEEGGRRTPLRSRVRVAVRFGLAPHTPTPELNDCNATFLDREWVTPGERCTVRLSPLVPDYVRPKAAPGLEIEFWEGKPIARGTITSIRE